MILCVDYETAHFFGGVLPAQAKLRYQTIVERQQWEIHTFNGCEYDQYDTPATTYLMWLDEDKQVKAVSRLNPTDRPYMLKDIWPELVTKYPMPASPKIWESSRMCIDKNLSPVMRKRIVSELVLAHYEYCTMFSIERVLGVMPPFIFKTVWQRSGTSMETMGPIKRLDDGTKIVAAWGECTVQEHESVKQATGIYEPVLHIHKSILPVSHQYKEAA